MNDYNTQREKLIMPEYGRHIQKMIEYVAAIEDREKRNEQVRAVVAVMGILNPQLRDLSDFRHKLWDHVQIISDFKIEIDSPYPIPTQETFSTKPNPVPLNNVPLKVAHYGRNIQNMVDMVADRPDNDTKRGMILVLANHMRQQYLIWNKESVSEEIIFRDIVELSGGRLVIPKDMHLSTAMPVHSPPHTGYGHRNNMYRSNKRKNNNNTRKKK